MNKTLYVTKDGTLKRKNDTLMMEMRDGASAFLPIEAIEEIFVMGSAEITTRLVDLLNRKGIVLHVFNYYGNHVGTWYPTARGDGDSLLTQAAFWLDEGKRHGLAAAFVVGAIDNMRRVVNFCQQRRPGLDASDILEELARFEELARATGDVPSLLGVEGSARNAYYKLFDRVIQDGFFKMGKRTRRPPLNATNALISFLNCLCYSMTLTQICQTRLEPRISFLHSPSDRRLSLHLDLSEVFKPLLVDRLIFTLVNKRMLHKEDFCEEDGAILMTKEARRLIAQAWDERLDKTLTDPATGKRVSWRQLVLTEARKVQSHILDGIPYIPFQYKW